jgi:hypothetical protein
VGPETVGYFGEEKNTLLSTGIRNPDRPARGLVTCDCFLINWKAKAIPLQAWTGP